MGFYERLNEKRVHKTHSFATPEFEVGDVVRGDRKPKTLFKLTQERRAAKCPFLDQSDTRISVDHRQVPRRTAPSVRDRTGYRAVLVPV